MKDRKFKEDKPVLAICYDFDKTLSPDDMQAQGFIQSVGYEIADFWEESNKLAEENSMDQNLAYMYKMIDSARGRVVFTKQKLKECGEKVQLFPGVDNWFKRIRDYGESHGVIVEHYIISCGLREMIKGTSVADEFEEIYASSFYYDDKDVALWPAQVVNYTNKTQYLFRIEKGVLDINDSGVNDYFAPEDIRVPFRNMVYIGDSDTDVPCMKLVNNYGGHSIGVYNSKTGDKSKVFKMMRENRIRYFAPADYSDGSEIDKLVKSIIIRTAANEVLESYHYENKRENIEADKQSNEDELKKMDLIINLENSRSFARTHEIIEKLKKYKNWSDDEKELLFRTGANNNQVYYILKDADVCLFYRGLLGRNRKLSADALKVKEALDSEG